MSVASAVLELRRWRPDLTAALVLGVAAAWSMPASAAGEAKGTVTSKARTVNVKYAYLVKGPDAVTKQTIRRLILSATDLSAKIAACKTMSCTDSGLGDGLSVVIEGGPRLYYWMVMNDQKIQYSGTEASSALAARIDDAKQLAGTLKFDKTGAGGPKVDVEFDATLVKEVTAP
ncbi:MAG: hypothetical protein ABI593_05110 [Betaproteobacteria bacterium]